MGDEYCELRIGDGFSSENISVFYKHEGEKVKVPKNDYVTVKINMDSVAKIWLESIGNEPFPKMVYISTTSLSYPTAPEDYTFRFKKTGDASKPTWKFYFKRPGKARDSSGDIPRASDTVTIGDIPPDQPGNEGD